MSPTAEVAFQQVMALPVGERAEVIDALELAAEPTEAEVRAALHPAWHAEIARRAAAIKAGTAVLVPGDEVMARARKRAGLDG